MNIELFGRAMIVGCSIAAPVGPVGVACIQRTLAAGARAGFVSGLGAATADAVYGGLGAFGASAVTTRLVSLRIPLAVLGGLFLCWMGARILAAVVLPGEAPKSRAQRTDGAFVPIFLLTLANPMTILSFVAVFGSLAGGVMTERSGALVMVAGVFAGSALWWLSLAGAVSCLRERMDPRWELGISRLAGAFLLGLGFWQLAALVLRAP